MNPLEIIGLYNQVRSNPQMLSQMMLNRGIINQQAFNAMQGMSPSQMGSYLMNNGVLNQNMFNQLSSQATQMQQQIGH